SYVPKSDTIRHCGSALRRLSIAGFVSFGHLMMVSSRSEVQACSDCKPLSLIFEHSERYRALNSRHIRSDFRPSSLSSAENETTSCSSFGQFANATSFSSVTALAERILSFGNLLASSRHVCGEAKVRCPS